MNNKGFAISSIIYSILILFIILVFGILSILGSRKIVLDKLKNNVMGQLNGDIVRVNDPKLIVEATTLNINKGQTVDLLNGVTASDYNGVSLTVTCKIGESNCITTSLAAGTYTITYTAIDSEGNSTSRNRELAVIWVCPYTIGQVINFDYTGAVQTFNVQCDGTYKMEIWGAQGGNGYYNSAAQYGGLGGYSVGSYTTTQNTNLYVYIGGQGASYGTAGGIAYGYGGGGFNGGGNARAYSSGTYNSGAGGGATHIATSTGIISSLSSNLSAILVVAGGGGGGKGEYAAGSYLGSAGGFSGVLGTDYNGNASGTAATQSSGGYNSYSNGGVGLTGTFGQGGAGTDSSSYHGPGGGGGYYGGTGGCYGCAGGGGSGYLGGVSSNATYGITKQMYCYNCTTSAVAGTLTYTTTNMSATPTSNYAKTGNGYAKITYLGN